MDRETLKKLYYAQPFTPFSLCMNDGRRLKVEHPEWIMIPPTGRTIMVYTTETDFSFVDLPLVESIEVSGKSKKK